MEFATYTLTDVEKQFNDYLHKEHKPLMEKAYKLFSRKGQFYPGGIYGYNHKGYCAFNKDIYTLARQFENDFADMNGITMSVLDNVEQMLEA